MSQTPSESAVRDVCATSARAALQRTRKKKKIHFEAKFMQKSSEQMTPCYGVKKRKSQCSCAWIVSTSSSDIQFNEYQGFVYEY